MCQRLEMLLKWKRFVFLKEGTFQIKNRQLDFLQLPALNHEAILFRPEYVGNNFETVSKVLNVDGRTSIRGFAGLLTPIFLGVHVSVHKARRSICRSGRANS